MQASGKPKEASIRARVIRLDGSVEDLGVISYWHRNPLKRLWWWVKRQVGEGGKR